jgi:ubiquinone/menaquinone biosynthesis C-methylase UbiE
MDGVSSRGSVVTAQSEFWSKVAQRYDRVVDLQIGGRTRAMVRERAAQERRFGSLAEFGCGTGFFTQVLAGKADRVAATDLSPAMLAIAHTRVDAANVRFQVEDCQRTSFEDGAFDAAFLTLVLHFTDPEKTLAEMRRILKPGGTLIIANPDRAGLSGLDRLRSSIRIFYRGVTGYRVKPPKGLARNVGGEGLLRLLAEHGFAVTSAQSIRDGSRSSNVPIQYVRAAKVK